MKNKKRISILLLSLFTIGSLSFEKPALAEEEVFYDTVCCPSTVTICWQPGVGNFVDHYSSTVLPGFPDCRLGFSE